jgi:hypothetical protein
MSEGIMRILYSCFTTSRSVSSRHNLPPTITFMSCLSSLVRVGKLKGVQSTTQLTKASSNLYSDSLRITQVKDPTTTTSADKVRTRGRGNATIKASTVKVGTLLSTGVETLFLLK